VYGAGWEPEQKGQVQRKCESFGETEEESRKETDQAAEQEEKRKEE
jgi:hypothetical protein